MTPPNKEPQELSAEVLDVLASVCRFLPNFIDDGTWDPTTPLESLVMGTLARARGTYETIIELAITERSLQAAMLGRSLFEDMAVAHWLVLHREDPDWLIQRYIDHRDALRLHDATVPIPGNWSRRDMDISDLAGREEDLRRQFGRYAERDWWGVDRAGTRVTMPDLISRLAAAEHFHPRLRGDEPILEQYYAFLQKAWTQALHHTAAGIHLRLAVDGGFPTAVAGARPVLVLSGNYWVFGQLIFVALELGAPADAIHHFEKVFLSGLAVFGEGLGVPVPWASQVAEWADEAKGA
jgi:hypothetical protein